MLDKKKKWFQISQRQRMSPFPNYMSMESITREMRTAVGFVYQQIVSIFRDNVMYVFGDKVDHERVGRGVLKKVLAQPDIFVRLAKKQKQLGREFIKFLKNNNRPATLKKISNTRLVQLHEAYEKRYKQIYSIYFPILSIEIYFFEYLRDYIRSKEKDYRNAARYVDILITERQAMINRREKIAALKICRLIKNNPAWLRHFDNQRVEKTIDSIKEDVKLWQLINGHLRNFFWITRDYDDPVLTLPDFIARFKKHLAGNPQSALNSLDQEEKKLVAERNRIYNLLKIDKYHHRLFQIMREGIYYKKLRKWIVSQTLYYYDPILAEIARRGGLSIRQARHLMTGEVGPMLDKGLEMADTLNERIKLSIFHSKNGWAKVYTGRQAREYYDYLVKVDPKSTVLYGMPVASGKVSGPVKIVINPDSFHKVEPGDIIVTLQATPVFSPVLSIASGLICDGGPGITSHPATLAREAGIPGIIGLRMATKILKDGQKVFIDGDEGIVKILK